MWLGCIRGASCAALRAYRTPNFLKDTKKFMAYSGQPRSGLQARLCRVPAVCLHTPRGAWSRKSLVLILLAGGCAA